MVQRTINNGPQFQIHCSHMTSEARHIWPAAKDQRVTECLHPNFIPDLHLASVRPKVQGSFILPTSEHNESRRSESACSCSKHRQPDTYAVLHKSHTWLTPPLCLCALVSVFVTRKTHSQVDQRQSCSVALLYFSHSPMFLHCNSYLLLFSAWLSHERRSPKE